MGFTHPATIPILRASAAAAAARSRRAGGGGVTGTVWRQATCPAAQPLAQAHWKL